MQRYLISTVFLLIGLLPTYGQGPPEEIIRYADMVFYNGQVLTMDRDDTNFSIHQAVALRDGRVIASGDDARILRMAGPNAMKIDLEGRTLMPGVIDTHSHPENYAQRHFQNDFRSELEKLDLYKTGHISMLDWNDTSVALSKLKQIVNRAAPGQWVIVSVGHEIEPGSAKNAKALRLEFDKIAPDNPLTLQQSTTHAVVNTKALEMILKKYGDMPGVYRDEQGSPTGYLFGGARGALDEILPKPPPDLFITAYKKELEEWAAMGVTLISTRLKPLPLTAYALMDRKGEMPIRIAYTHQIGWWNPLPARDLWNVGGLQGHGTDMLWMTGIAPAPPDDATDSEGGVCSEAPKLRMLVTDVVAKEMRIGNQTTVVTKDLYPEGLCRWLRPGGEVSREAVLAANRLGYRIAGVHTFGDKGVGTMFDAFEEANLDRPIAGRRFAIDHTMMVSPEIITRAAKLGIIWSVQPQMAESPRSDLTMMTYGERVANEWLQPVKSIMNAGMRVTYGADTHGDRARPMFGLEFLVTRRNHRGMIYGPQEAIDRKSALLMMTRWGAEYVEREDELGSIEAGKIADLVVLDKNPLDPAVADEQLSDIQVLMTLVGGEIKFTEKNFAESKGLPQVGYRGRFSR
ncbi:amidohydrolase family protein [Acidobacteria bacterium AH-259-D05]|nr:amidohydrolase family protein [Acidobacteria bacterium AH-259-D05]